MRLTIRTLSKNLKTEPPNNFNQLQGVVKKDMKKAYVIKNVWSDEFYTGDKWSSVRFAKIFETEEQAETELYTLDEPYLTVMKIFTK